MKEKILTVVVPTYNVEKYIRQNLESMEIPEIMDDLEVLVVSDGSKDSSADIAKEFEAKYPGTYRVIEKENGGHGSTINRGILEAKGKYFKVVDADDWLLKDGLINLVNTLKNTDSDLVVSRFYWYHDDKQTTSVEVEYPVPKAQYNREYAFEEVSHDMYVKMHGMTVKTDILRQIPKIDENCFYVDVEYVLFPIPLIKTVTVIEDYVYMYRIGIAGQSMDPEKMKKNQENFDRVLNRMYSFYDECKNAGLDDSRMSYITDFLARVTAGRFKIFLSLPYSRKVKKEMIEFDKMLKLKYPSIFRANRQSAVKMLRLSRYHLYYIAQRAYKKSL